MKHLLIFLSLIFLSSQAFPQNTQITSFSKSKKLLMKLYKDNPVTLYCGCSLKGKKPNLSSCRYIPKKNGEVVIPSVSLRRGKSSKEGSAQER
jgi:endonuclease I